MSWFARCYYVVPPSSPYRLASGSAFVHYPNPEPYTETLSEARPFTWLGAQWWRFCRSFECGWRFSDYEVIHESEVVARVLSR